MKRIKKIIKILQCVNCSGDLKLEKNKLVCNSCKEIYPIVNEIPRFVDKSYYNLSEINKSNEEKIKNYFGWEWDIYKDWGFVKEKDLKDLKDLKDDEKIEWKIGGGTVKSRKSAFKSKCQLTEYDLKNSSIILDAGCGNGRYTFEAAVNTKNIIIGVDLAYGAVNSAYENTKNLDNVIIIQASLFNLPFKNNTIDACFSNGVLHFTGNAHRAFNEVCRTMKGRGIFVAHIIHKLNPIWQLNDYLIRKYTARCSINQLMGFARKMSNFAKIVQKRNPSILNFLNYFFRLQPTVHHMYDWYCAPVISYHTYPEVEGWFKENSFNIIKTQKPPKIYFIKRPWALNIKGQKL